MKGSEAMYDIIKEFEGEKLTAYVCPAGYLTIGYGYVVPPDYASDAQKLIWETLTGVHPSKVVAGKTTITKEAADNLFSLSISGFESSLNKMIQSPLSQSEFDALLSFIYNLGPAVLDKSGIKNFINNSDFDCVTQKMMLYCKLRVGGELKTSRGLLVRRAVESLVFMHPEIDTKVTAQLTPVESKRVLDLLTKYKLKLKK